MDNSNLFAQVNNIIKTYPIISEQISQKRLQIILEQLTQCLINNTPGAVVEFGCYKGTTSLFLRRVLNLEDNGRELHVYDSFAGLPAKSIKDASVSGSNFKAGELKSSKKDLIHNFKKAGLKPPIIHKGWFSDLKDNEVPDLIAFAFLDSDFYDSILDSLNLVWPKIERGGVIIIDDYQTNNLPGVHRAVEDFFKQLGIALNIRHQQDLAIIIKS